MKRWITVNPFDGSEVFDYTLPKKEWDESIVDKSHFIPVAEALKNLEANSASMHSDLTRFDFPDGKDNGMTLPPSRRPGADIAEVQEYVEMIDNSAKQKFNDALERQKAVEAMKKASQVQSEQVE
uniref:Uncharacterized protein n=1 Tax=Dulem virus 253 TaxID=3145730 RepID=A0AAU8AYE9_9VIRU